MYSIILSSNVLGFTKLIQVIVYSLYNETGILKFHDFFMKFYTISEIGNYSNITHIVMHFIMARFET